MRVVGEANKYLSDQAPWKLKEDPARRDTVLHTALQAIKDCNALLTPFLPHSAQKVHELLGGTGVWSRRPRSRRSPTSTTARRTRSSPATTTRGRRLGVHAAAAVGHAAGPADADLHQARPVDRRRGAPAPGGREGSEPSRVAA